MNIEVGVLSDEQIVTAAKLLKDSGVAFRRAGASVVALRRQLVVQLTI